MKAGAALLLAFALAGTAAAGYAFRHGVPEQLDIKLARARIGKLMHSRDPEISSAMRKMVIHQKLAGTRPELASLLEGLDPELTPAARAEAERALRALELRREADAPHKADFEAKKFDIETDGIEGDAMDLVEPSLGYAEQLSDGDSATPRAPAFLGPAADTDTRIAALNSELSDRYDEYRKLYDADRFDDIRSLDLDLTGASDRKRVSPPLTDDEEAYLPRERAGAYRLLITTEVNRLAREARLPASR